MLHATIEVGDVGLAVFVSAIIISIFLLAAFHPPQPMLWDDSDDPVSPTDRRTHTRPEESAQRDAAWLQEHYEPQNNFLHLEQGGLSQYDAAAKDRRFLRELNDTTRAFDGTVGDGLNKEA